MALFLTSALFAGAAAAAAPASAEGRDFRWEKNVSAQSIEIEDISGGVRLEPSAGDAVRVVATKRGRASDFGQVTVMVREDGDKLRVCALWPGQKTCGDRSPARSDGLDVHVDFVVSVPAKIARVSASTLDGGISLRDLDAEARLRTLNGSIDSIGRGALDAETMNGNVGAKVAQKGRAAHIVTKNGRVELALPADADADVDASTMRGKIRSSFGDVPAPPFPGFPAKARFRLGAGGVAVSLETMNGDVVLSRL